MLAQVHQVQWLGQQGLRGKVMGLLLQVHLTGDRDQDQDYRVHLVLAHQLQVHEILGFPPLVDLQMMTDQCGSNLQG